MSARVQKVLDQIAGTLPVEKEITKDGGQLTHQYHPDFSLVLNVSVRRKPGTWAWYATISIIGRNFEFTISPTGSFGEDKTSIQRLSGLFLNYTVRPAYMARRDGGHDLALNIIRYLETVDKTQFLELVERIWAEELLMILRERRRPRVSIEEYMRPIMRIGHKFGLTVLDFDAIEERLRKAIEAGILLTK